MIPDSWYAPLSVLAGLVLIVFTLLKVVTGKRESAYILIGKLVVAIFAIAFGVLLYQVGNLPK